MMGAYCRTHGTSEHVDPVTGEPMDCDRAQQIRARLTAHTPTAQESATFWADVPIEQEWPVVDATDGQEPVSEVGVAVDTSEHCKAGRTPHSKPKVSVHYGCAYDDAYGVTCQWRHWRWWCSTCRIEATDFCTQPDAFAAALRHVRDYHSIVSPVTDALMDQWEPCGLGVCAAPAGHEGTCAEASGWADEDADVVHTPLTGVFTSPKPSAGHIAGDPGGVRMEPVGNPDKPRTLITVTPDQLEAVQRIFDAFGVKYTTDDALNVNPFPPDPDHLSQVADALTTLTANRRALDDAHRLGGPRA